MEEPQKKNRLFVFIIIFVAVGAILFSVENSKINEELRLIEEREREIWNILDSTPLEAKAVSIWNITENKKVYGKNDTEVLPIASLAKIMTVVQSLVGRDENEIVEISPEAIRQVGDYGFFVNEKWKIGDLAKITLTVSANDGAYVLATKYSDFLEKVNNKITRMGATNASFMNFTGLDKDVGTAGVFASAEDVNLMASYLLKAHPEIAHATTFSEITLTSESGFTHNFKNTNIIVEKIPNLLFSKTGYTDVAGGSLAIIFKNKKGHDIAVTILGSGFEERFSDMEKIVGILYNI